MTDKQKNKLLELGGLVAAERAKRVIVEKSLVRIAENLQKIILDGGDPGADTKAKKEELVQIDSRIVNLQAEAREIVVSAVTEMNAKFEVFNSQVAAARVKAGKLLAEFLSFWAELGKLTSEDYDATSRKEFNAFLEKLAPQIGNVPRLDPNAAMTPRPSVFVRGISSDAVLVELAYNLTGKRFEI